MIYCNMDLKKEISHFQRALKGEEGRDQFEFSFKLPLEVKPQTLWADCKKKLSSNLEKENFQMFQS